MLPKKLVPFVVMWVAVAIVTLGTTLVFVAMKSELALWNAWVGNLVQAVYVSLTFYLVWLTFGLFQIASTATDLSKKDHRQKITPILITDITEALDIVVAAKVGEFRMHVDLKNLSDLPAFNVFVFFDFRPYKLGTYTAVDELDSKWRYKALPNMLDWPNSVGGAQYFVPTLQAHAVEPIRVSIPLSKELRRFTRYLKGLEYPYPWMSPEGIRSSGHHSMATPVSLVVTVVYSDLYGNETYTVQEDIGAAARSVHLKMVRPPLAEVGFALDDAWDFDRTWSARRNAWKRHESDKENDLYPEILQGPDPAGPA